MRKAWWHIPLFQDYFKTESRGLLCVRGQPGLKGKFEDSQNFYVEKIQTGIELLFYYENLC